VVAALTPLSVGGMIVAASTALLADSRTGARRHDLTHPAESSRLTSLAEAIVDLVFPHTPSSSEHARVRCGKREPSLSPLVLEIKATGKVARVRRRRPERNRTMRRVRGVA
jgi:hypothetical protein